MSKLNDGTQSQLAEEKTGVTASTRQPKVFPGLPLPVTQASTTADSGRQKIIRGLRGYWEWFMKHMGTESPSLTSAIVDSILDSGQVRPRTEDGTDADVDEVDEIVVDRDWTEDMKNSPDHSEYTPEISGDSHMAHIGAGTSASGGHDSTTFRDDGGPFRQFLILLRWEVWPAVHKFFHVHFNDEKTEERYQGERWCIRKLLALWSAIFFIANWVIGASTIATPITVLDKSWIWGFIPAHTIPLLFLVIFDFPRDRPIPYQLLLMISTWSWCLYEIVTIYVCGYYSVDNTCGTKDFLGTFYYTSALQTIALFGMRMDRIAAMVGSLSFLIISSTLILPYKPIWTKHMLNFLLYHTFLLFVHYMHENSERRLFILREQLKDQYKATQKAQINERKEADSKRRLTSYVFHDKYMPLNTALLAVQNMEASCAVSKAQEIEFMALGGSLVMMSKVLNDMLDLFNNRMDSGRFEILSKPYAFHAVMRSLFIPLRMATDARNLELVTCLDESIDKVARQAAYEAAGENITEFEKYLNNKEDGIVLGDATRLRQIINNLASNACKFTPAGGRVICSTRLIFPTHPAPQPSDNPRPKIDMGEDVIEEVLCAPADDPAPPHDPMGSGVQVVESSTKKGPLKQIVVRIEVSDTGHGIPPREMAQGKLFSAFNQTEQGRQQGGKGTGLGLALVRQIVRLSGGRLGLRSKVGHGSTFWVELPLGVGVKVVDEPDPESTLREKQRNFELAGPLSVDLLTSRAPTQAVSTNITQTMMDKGGLVQLNLPNATDGSESHLFTRTISGLPSAAQPDPPLPTPPIDGSGENLGSPGMFSRTENHSTDSSPTVVADSPKSLVDATPLPAIPSMSTRSDPQVRKPSLVSQISGSQPLPVSRKGSMAGFDPPIIVLVVDDDRLTRTVMSRMLTRLGCAVSTAENGEIALEMITSGTPKTEDGPNSRVFDSSHDSEKDQGAEDGEVIYYDVVFLDNQMPVMTGLEVVSKLREMGRGDFVVGITGNALINDQKEYSEAGVNHILTKPVFESSLVKMLTIANERRRK